MILLQLFSLYTGLILRPQQPLQKIEIMTGTASRYRYSLQEYPNWSDQHSTCAFHHKYKDYGTYEVCNLENEVCIQCFNNDWMRRDDRLVDLSNYAFRKLAPLNKGLIQVTVRKVE